MDFRSWRGIIAVCARGRLPSMALQFNRLFMSLWRLWRIPLM
jgi:hypothetical protein